MSTAPPTVATLTAGGVDLLSWRFVQDPYATYQDLRDAGTVRRHVVKTLATELNAWVVTDYDNGRALLTDPRLSKDAVNLPAIVNARAVDPNTSAPEHPRSMLFSDPPEHTRLRKLIGKAFTMRRVERMREWIEQTTDELLDQVITPGEEFDLVEEIALALPIYVIGNLLGVPAERFGDFKAWSGALASVDISAEEKQRAIGQAFGYLGQLIQEKRANPGEDMVSALIEADDDGVRLTDTELMSTIFLVMNAGYETTANMISSGVLALLQHPEQLALLRSDLSLLPGAVEEFLRYESPLNLSTIRFTTSPVQVGEVTIPENEIVFVALMSANRDPARFADPNRLDVTRTSNAHLSFGHGVHHCLGAPLARLEGEIVFRKLLERFPDWELAAEPAALRWRYTAQFRGLETLPVRLT
ncbi:cytochrome P450 [Kitasatospora sp. MAA4]|uniref:cytochrome P450 family protein n=1 Tax=Kitasatospora sp. MAA4 TaxID=3035093 RepID=UPI00247646F9|nr:cytochrome P450 [Kitasatospora sp. MAA4]MDH6131110.1 cytochrome P450 [Kitasatospora sp. MAA4]